MAATPTPKPTRADPGVNPALAPLQALDAAVPLAVALSGGADSTALLHAAAAVWPGQVRAIHVHHGLQAAADSFVAHCEALCHQLSVPLQVVRVAAGHARGESPEDAARKARYLALAQAANAAGLHCVLLAQHADDQAETLLLALSRGAGLPGMAAMPERFERHGTVFLRPVLGVSAPSLRRWLTQAQVGWVEDPTNTDTGLTRNRIRLELLPALQRAFPHFRETFARSARHAAQAQALLSEMAADDLAAIGGQPRIADLRRLPPVRRANLLRHWLRSQHGASPSAAQLEELLSQVAACSTRGHQIRIKVAEGLVAREGEVLVFTRQI
jgi:tRNA(Ile)-lysidine synthase